MKKILLTTLIFLICMASCYTTDEPDPGEPLPSQPSSIQPTAIIMAGSTRIDLYYPKPFQSLPSGEINFLYHTIADYHSEIYIFNKQPDIGILQSGDFSGCVAGISVFAGHAWNSNTARLGATLADTQFYKCALAGPDILHPTEKTIYPDFLTPGTYFWFIVGYNDDYLITHASEVRIFTIL